MMMNSIPLRPPSPSLPHQLSVSRGVMLTCPLPAAAAGLPDLLQQRGRWSSERHRGVQVPVCMGPLELPGEGSAAVHPQQPAQW